MKTGVLDRGMWEGVKSFFDLCCIVLCCIGFGLIVRGLVDGNPVGSTWIPMGSLNVTPGLLLINNKLNP